MLARLAPILLLGCVALLLTGCASTRPAPSDAAPASPAADSIAYLLKQETANWSGTPYRLGGTSQAGVDCSGFVAHLYARVLDRSLPRTTADQARTGHPVDPNTLQPGDLVFFQLPRKQRHVGVYLRDHQFAHASVSQGVTISDLADTYWRRHYWTARRLLPDLNHSEPVASEAPIRRASSDRSGW